MTRPGRRLAALVAFLASVLLVVQAAWPARAPDIVEKSFTYRGDAARALAALLELSPDRRTAQFELSQMAEHRALPERDDALHDPDPSGELSLPDWHTSTRVHETATWDPGTGVLQLEGYVADRKTALPRQSGLAFSFASPWFSESEADQVPAWKPLLAKLATLPATTAAGGAVVRTLDIALDGQERATLALWHMQGWDSKNQPVPKSFVVVTFGPPLQGPGSASHACGCRVGPARNPWGAFATLGALLSLTWRRRRGYFAYPTARVSRTTVTRIWPG